MRTFRNPPSMGRVYLAALTQRRPPFEGDELPMMKARLEAQPLLKSRLEKYRSACGSRAEVPVGYPQMLVTPVHVALLTDDEFPLRAMGLVHPRFSIVQHRTLQVEDEVDFETWFGSPRKVRNGIEFDIETRAYVDQDLAWESTAATFYRTGSERGESTTDDDDWKDRRAFMTPANAGRRYARVSGDANPVHLHPWTARIFGYKNPIAHGWWLVARTLAELELDGPSDPTRFTFEFRRPVFLGRSGYELARGSDEGRFAIVDTRDKIRLDGRIEPV